MNMLTKIRKITFVSALLTLMSTLGCARTPSKVASSEATREDLTAPYSPGTWRLARYALDDVALTVSHILVRYDGQRPYFSFIRAPDWNPDPPVARTRAQAIKLAVEIATEAREHPERFAALAAARSDDIVTRDRGGSLGTWSASLMPDKFLDALTAMRPGDVSRVIETDVGFHVLMLRDTPPEQHVAGARIVVGYRQTQAFDVRAGRDVSRSRADAERLAKTVAFQAKANPAAFSTLLETYSDAADVIRGGDMGVWSTHRAFVLNREIEVLAGLAIGQVSEPVDSASGFEVLLRTAPRPRVELALENLAVPYADDASLGLANRQNAEAIVERARAELDESPQKFAQLQAAYCCEHCCDDVEQWQPGTRDDPGRAALEQRVAALPIGGFSGPFESGGVFRLVRRVEPIPAPPDKRTTTTIPNPNEPDIAGLVRVASDGAALAQYMASLTKVVDGLGAGFDVEHKRHIREVFNQFETDLNNPDPEQRVSALLELRAELKATLGDQLASELRKRVLEQVTADLAPEVAARLQR